MAGENPSPEESTGTPAGLAEAARAVLGRITHCRIRAFRLQQDTSEPQVLRDVACAYLGTLCRNRVAFVRAALRYLQSRQVELPEAGRYCLTEMLVHPPARWEFEHLDLFGTVGDALSCAGRYRTCDQFVAVYPVVESDPLFGEIEERRIPLRHKPSSPWFQAYRRRMELKHDLGSFRWLVGYARKMNKAEFLEQFLARPGEVIKMVDRNGRPYQRIRLIPDIPPHRLLNLTGYTPGEFWREVRKPNSVKQHKPQLELF